MADEARAHEDILHLLQVESVVKRVPSRLNNVRRIVQYAKDPEDDGSDDPLGSAPTEAWLMWALIIVTVLALVSLFVFYLRTGDSASKGEHTLLQQGRADDTVDVDLDFSDAKSKTYFMQNVMKTLKTIEE